MVQLSMITIVLTSALSGLVSAKSCHNGGIYCGASLMQRGNYITKINTNLGAMLIAKTDYNEKNSLWLCGDHGDIEFKQLCVVGCFANGKNDDSCGEEKAAEAAAAAAAKREIGWVA